MFCGGVASYADACVCWERHNRRFLRRPSGDSEFVRFPRFATRQLQIVYGIADTYVSAYSVFYVLPDLLGLGAMPKPYKRLAAALADPCFFYYPNLGSGVVVQE